MTNEIEIGDAELLFKYVSAERGDDVPSRDWDGALRATQPAAMNDPFECAMTKIFVETDRNRGNRELALTLTEIQPRNPVTEENVDESRVRHGSLYMESSSGSSYQRGSASSRSPRIRFIRFFGLTTPWMARVSPSATMQGF